MRFSGVLRLWFVVFSSLMVAFTASASSFWQDSEPLAQRGDQAPMAQAKGARHLQADFEVIRQLLLSNDNVDIDIPLPNGEMAVYHFEWSPIAEQGLLDKFPEIRTFRGVDVDNPANTGRFDISPLGFRGMFKHGGETLYIDPQYIGNTERYMAYSGRTAEPMSARPAEQLLYTDLLKSAERAGNRTLAKGSADGTLRTYRLAVAATRQYTNIFGGGSPGTVTQGLAAITTAINRVNQVFENDLGIRLTLVANNNLIIQTDADPGPYDNSSGVDELGRNQTRIDAVIGSANYDIGHLFGTGPGGVASLGSVCNASVKAQGLTGLPNPTGDAFFIDFVAHEIGHQFRGNHTFNGTAGTCGLGGQRNQGTAYEVGSGSTIMAYAGICGAENLQNNSDPYFHAGSIAEITAFVQNPATGGSCGVSSNPANATPNASAGADVTIPANTPFVLTGSATDADAGDTLTYIWEQMDTGTATASTAEWVDNGNRTIFRSRAPSTNPTRYFPNLTDVLDGSIAADEGEAFPTTNRNLNFRFTVRDSSGQTAFENRVVTVSASAGPFTVTAPAAGSTWTQGTVDVVWNVANTNVAPVNCSNVDILFSSDGGSTFPTTLASNTPNDGVQSVTVPVTPTTTARVMVQCRGNVFFAVSNGDSTVSSSTVASVTNVSNPSANEGDPLAFTVSLSAAPPVSQTVAFTLANGTASADDFNSVFTVSNSVTINTNGTLTIPAGVSSFTVTVQTTEDTTTEPNETLTLTVAGRTGTGTILNDDTPPSVGGGGGGGAAGLFLLFICSMIALNRRRSIKI